MSNHLKCPYCDGTGVLKDEAASMGARIMLNRKAAKMTQEDLAGKVGRSRPQIANIESGRSDIPVSMLGKIAEALGVNPKDLLP